MAKGYYTVADDAAENADKVSREIIFETFVSQGEEIPEDQQNLMLEISNTLHIISLLYDYKTSEFKMYYDQLLSLAKTGLEGSFAQPTLAARALIQLKKEVVDRESGKRKNNYLKELGTKALVAISILLIASWVLNQVVTNLLECRCAYIAELSNLGILCAGTMVGVWLSFAISRTELSFEDLGIIEKDRLEPTIRLIFTGLLALIFGLLFIKKAIEIKLGDLSSHDIAQDPVTAFLIGAILGVNEKILGGTLTKKTADLFK